MSADIPRLITNLKLVRDDSHVMHHPAIEEVIAKLVEMEWQPIESAPRDGTHVWLFCPDDAPQQLVGEWIEGKRYALWAYVDVCLRELAPHGPQPTHWQPLPKPPAIDAASGERK